MGVLKTELGFSTRKSEPLITEASLQHSQVDVFRGRSAQGAAAAVTRTGAYNEGSKGAKEQAEKLRS